eukprot:MONOS_14373.2-p1 / transcript=MONOS_14373.2 / gene=MONOS_14373 / organism=Monocercomonoides_exilis_PA203 / gene_product=Alpha , phosphatidylcholine-sterol O-acyltransferase, putative / transcript_product=phosphatidylcholine-sterol O-acyltransferase, putative / location=Mono_scaffold00991:960-3187(+) / protein_length=706 / sequence_SO=supercontig / SO=protein_coding / is_pseudo=false
MHKYMLGKLNCDTLSYVGNNKNYRVFVPDGNYGLEACDELFPRTPVPHRYNSYFHDIIVMLKSQGYKPGINLWGFPYDWREEGTLFSTEQGLVNRIDEAYEACGKQKVTIITHSLGGQLFRLFLQLHPLFASSRINKWIALACPFLGAGRHLTAFLNGYALGMPSIFMKASSMQSLSISTLGTYWFVQPENVPFSPKIGIRVQTKGEGQTPKWSKRLWFSYHVDEEGICWDADTDESVSEAESSSSQIVTVAQETSTENEDLEKSLREKETKTLLNDSLTTEGSGRSISSEREVFDRYMQPPKQVKPSSNLSSLPPSDANTSQIEPLFWEYAPLQVSSAQHRSPILDSRNFVPPVRASSFALPPQFRLNTLDEPPLSKFFADSCSPSCRNGALKHLSYVSSPNFRVSERHTLFHLHHPLPPPAKAGKSSCLPCAQPPSAVPLPSSSARAPPRASDSESPPSTSRLQPTSSSEPSGLPRRMKRLSDLYVYLHKQTYPHIWEPPFTQEEIVGHIRYFWSLPLSLRSLGIDLFNIFGTGQPTDWDCLIDIDQKMLNSKHEPDEPVAKQCSSPPNASSSSSSSSLSTTTTTTTTTTTSSSSSSSLSNSSADSSRLHSAAQAKVPSSFSCFTEDAAFAGVTREMILNAHRRFTVVDGDRTVPAFSAANDMLDAAARFELRGAVHTNILWDKRCMNIISAILGLPMPYPSVF